MVFEIEMSLAFSALILEFKNKAEIYTFSRITPTGGRNSKIAESHPRVFRCVSAGQMMGQVGKVWVR